MNELQMRLCGDLTLRETCAPVADASQLSIIMDNMIQVMESQRGVGLAAPQVGDTRRFLVMFDPDTKKYYRMVNPVITSRSDKTCKMEEGCLSVVDKTDTPIFADVVRPEAVVVEWTDDAGKKHTEKMTGYLGRIVQHEIDHLDGVLFIDYLSPVKREMVMRKTKKLKK